MSDNLHDLNVEEEEQDELIIDVALLKTQMSTANTNITNLSNQTAGSSSSGLLALVQANDTDIASIQSKTNLLTINEAVDLDNYDTINSNLTSINGMLEKDGTETILKTGAGNKIQFSVGGQNIFNSNEIKNLTDNVLISSNVNINTLDTELTGIKNNSLASTLKTAVDANSAKTGITSSQASAITANTAKTGITSDKTNAIASNSTLSAANQIVIVSIGTEKEGIKNNTLASTLKTNVDANTAKNSYPSGDATKVGHISVTQAVDLDTMESNISTNNSKVSTQWSNNGSEVYITQNVGIRTSDPNSDLEIGDGTTNVRMRLNGQNSQTNSSEIIFTDNRSGTNPEYYMGASIRFNSTDNRLEFLTDEGNDGTAEPAMFIYRAATPFIQVTHIFADDLSVQTCNLRPLSRYCYGKRVHSTTDTDSEITLTTGGVPLIYQNILSNGIVYNSSTGVWTVPTTGLYEVIATLNINCGSGPESVLSLFIKEGTTNVLKARSHVSRAEGNNNTAMQLNMNGIVRLEASTDYNFVCASNNSGTGTIQNDLAGNNCLIIKGAVLQNDTTVPSDWNS